ncbi:hypothetical protein AB0J72_12530 [Dactylosporangium sp. NPDC049742]|uniref:hypothetical protein n=1 Tax=Dactylosporangium sp. NPDC049742 TaxID=3154737 RepID=UPI00343F5962
MSFDTSRRRTRRWWLVLVAVLAVAVAAVWFLVRDEPAAPDAGDCLRKTTPSTFETADCGA